MLNKNICDITIRGLYQWEYIFLSSNSSVIINSLSRYLCSSIAVRKGSKEDECGFFVHLCEIANCDMHITTSIKIYNILDPSLIHDFYVHLRLLLHFYPSSFPKRTDSTVKSTKIITHKIKNTNQIKLMCNILRIMCPPTSL